MDALQFVSCALAALLVLPFLLFVFFKTDSKSHRSNTTKEPPEPAGAWPVVGHLRILSGKVPLHRTLGTLSDQYGPIFALRLGGKRAVVVSSMELARECLTTNDRAPAGRPPLLSGTILGYENAMLGIAPYGPFWRDMRKIATVELLSRRRIESLRHVWLEELDSLFRVLYQKCHVQGEIVDVKRPLSLLTLNITVRMVTGKRYLELDGEANDESAREFVKLIEEFFYLVGLFTVSDAFPWLRWLDIDGHGKTMKRVHKRMDEIVTSWLEEHRQKRSSSANIIGGDRGGGDFIHVLLDKLGDDQEADLSIKALALGMIIAGSDTMSGTLVWAISLLLNNRQVLERAQHELDVHVGRERHVDESDMKNLTYLEAIVKEVMRLCPSSPLLIPHESIEPVRIGKYRVSKGTTVHINVWKIQRDPMLWPDAEQFKPERFLASDRNFKDVALFGGKSFEFFPFSSGRRSCPGSLLGTTILQLTLARLIQGFDWSVPNYGPVDMTEGFGLTMHKVSPVDVFLRPRLASHLYACLIIGGIK